MLTRVCFAIALAAAVCAPVAAQVTDESSVPRISVADLKKALDAGQVTVIDVRDAESYANGHIPGAILVSLGDLKAKAGGLKGSRKPLVAYCG
jgi:phage shock protein E